MNMNWILILFALVLVIEVIAGFKRGFVRELISFISLIVICLIILIGINGLNAYFGGRPIGVLIAVILLVVVLILHRIINSVLLPAKLVTKLAIIKSIDKILGIVAGVLESVILLWTLDALVMFLDTGMVGEYILQCTQKSQILEWIYRHNLLATIVEGIIRK